MLCCFPAAIVDIVLSQTCGVILVGDPHQQIYSFRGAVNSLYAVPHTHIYYLTQVRACVHRITNNPSLPCSLNHDEGLRWVDHKQSRIRPSEGRNKAVSRNTTLEFRGANFDLFKDLLGGIPWAKELEVKRTQDKIGQWGCVVNLCRPLKFMAVEYLPCMD